MLKGASSRGPTSNGYKSLFSPLSNVKSARLPVHHLELNELFACLLPDGFDADLVIMEDADLCMRLHEYGRSIGRGRLRLNDRIVFTSGRRIAAIGQAKATAIYILIGFGWFFGIRSDNLRRLYKW